MTNQFKIRAQRHPKEGQGVQNEPRGVPEASRRRPRMSKKRPGGAKVELVLFYSSKWEPKGIPKGPKASKMSPEASQKRPIEEASRRRKARFSRVL